MFLKSIISNKNLILVLIIFLTFHKLNSQEVLIKKDVKLKSFFLAKDRKESFPIVNLENNEIGLFLLDNKEVKGYLFNSDYSFKGGYITERPKRKFSILLGGTYQHNNYSLLFTNDDKDEFFVKSINIVEKESTFNELEIKLKKEKFLELISYNNKLYLITILRGKSILNIYEIQGEKISKEVKIDLSNNKFSKANKSLDYLLNRTTAAVKEDIILNRIDNKNPNSIDLVSYPNKIYCYNNTIFITIDMFNDVTKVISINLTNFTSKVVDYPILKVDCGHDLGVKSNSFLIENYIFQVSGCKNELYYSITDIKTQAKLKEEKITKSEPIDFKNTPLIQLGGAFNKNKKQKELTATEKFLRKIEASNIGTSVYKSKDGFEVTIGGYKKMSTKELIATGLIASASFAIAASAGTTMGYSNKNYYHNPTMYSFETYSNARSVYFKSKLNNQLKNIRGNIDDNAFDRIRKYTDVNKKAISTMTVFKIDNYYVLGYYNKREGKYFLLKFVD